MNRAIFRTALLAASLPLLSGCVAALVPVVAGGLIGKEQLEGNKDEREVAVAAEDVQLPEQIREASPAPTQPASVPVVPAPAPIAETEFSEAFGGAAPTPAGTPIAEPSAEIERPTSDFIGPVDLEQDEVKLAVAQPARAASKPIEAATPSTAELKPPEPVEVVAAQIVTAAPAADLTPTLAPAPAPALAPPKAPALTSPAAAPIEPAPTAPSMTPSITPAGPTDFRAYDALYGYVDSQARRDPVQSPRQSALLAAPGTLSPIRTKCSIRPPAIVIDLDPGKEPVDVTMTPQANPALGQILTSFRLQEIDVFWISQRSAIAAGAIRKALVASGLDPQGRDGLLLMRSAQDRKQARRKELSETHCLLAIGGDNRADFDELYLYLKDESAAQPLEELIGAGWFLTPLPLTEGQ